jgi:hypothetical protein
MKEHFVSKKDVKKYDLVPFVQIDRFGRYKIPKYLSRKLSNIISQILSGFVCVRRDVGIMTSSGRTIRPMIKNTIDDVPRLLLNPNEELKKMLDEIQQDLDKDLVRNRTIKIWNIKNKMK